MPAVLSDELTFKDRIAIQSLDTTLVQVVNEQLSLIENPVRLVQTPTGFLGNEPSGMTELFAANGDSAGPNLCNDTPDDTFDAWGWRGTTGANTQSLDPATLGFPDSPAAVNPDGVWSMKFPAGHPNGNAPGNIFYNRSMSGLGILSMYWSFYLFVDPDFAWHSSTVKGWWNSGPGAPTNNNHFMYLGRVNGDGGVGPGFSGRHHLGPYMQFGDSPPEVAANIIYPGIPQAEFDPLRGQWLHTEMLFVANTEGNHDGKYRCWIDGSLEVSHDIIYWFDQADFDNNRVRFDRVTFNPTWGGGGVDSVPADQWVLHDDFYVSFSTARVSV